MAKPDQRQKQHWYRAQQRRRAQQQVQQIVVTGISPSAVFYPGLANLDQLADVDNWTLSGCDAKPVPGGMRIENNTGATQGVYIQMTESGGAVSPLTIPNKFPDNVSTGLGDDLVIGVSCQFESNGVGCYPSVRNEDSGFTPSSLANALILFESGENGVGTSITPGNKEWAFKYGNESNSRLAIRDLAPEAFAIMKYVSIWIPTEQLL